MVLGIATRTWVQFRVATCKWRKRCVFGKEINMHSAVISTYQQRHTSKSCEPSFRVRGVCGNRQRINLVHKSVPGLLALKDVCASTLFKSPWPIRTSLSVLLSSHGGRSSGQIRCSSSSIWRRSSPSANASGKAQPTEELWKEFFADPSQWWDNTVDKINYQSGFPYLMVGCGAYRGIPDHLTSNVR